MGQDTLKKLRADMEARFALSEAEQQSIRMTIDELQRPANQAANVTTHPIEYTDLPDGTKQFPNAPTGPVVEHPPAQMPAVPAAYVKGAIVRRKGQPFTSEVQAVGDGLIYVTVMDNGEPKDIWAPWGDFDLLSAAPV